MRVYQDKNFSSLYRLIVDDLVRGGDRVAPRGLPTREFLGVMTELEHPRERVLWTAGRRPNPFFQWMETIWILHGSRDVDWISFFNKQMRDFVDPDGTAWGVYGYRMRYAAGQDQLKTVIRRLTMDPESRQAVISLWHPTLDVTDGHRDYPCNTTLYFKVRREQLHLTVCNRSNDLHLGLAFTNITQFTTIMEVVAAALHVNLGMYRHYSDSLHIYEGSPHTRSVLDAVSTTDQYQYVSPTPILPRGLEEIEADVAALYLLHPTFAVCAKPSERDAVLARALDVIIDPYWRSAACAMAAYHSIDVGHRDQAVRQLLTMEACPDWFISCLDFVLRRYEKLGGSATSQQVKDQGLVWLAKHSTQPASALALWEKH